MHGMAILERRKTAEHAKRLADQVEKRAKRNLRVPEKSLDLEVEKLKTIRLKQGVRP